MALISGFGYDFQGVQGKDSVVRKCVEAFFSGAGLNATFIFLSAFPVLERLNPDRKRAEAERLLDDCVENMVKDKKERRKTGKGGRGADLLDMMLEAQVCADSLCVRACALCVRLRQCKF